MSETAEKTVHLAGNTTLLQVHIVENRSINISGTEYIGGDVAGTMNYEELKKKPKINSKELIGDKSGSDLNLQDKMDRVTEHDIDIMMFGDE